ncbi:MAG: ABC transporter ATP-binding protein [Balneolaceae bacterium]|nr:ABC transporter ATP-binding protein [Balneolaceae bacterium]
MMIRIHNLTKKYDTQTVLDAIDLEIPAGQATGIVGPNGSGKTTLIKHILGLVKPDSGDIEVNGIPLNGTWEYRREIGYMPQKAQYPENMTVRELFAFVKKIRDNEAPMENRLTGMFELEPELDKPLRNLSGGTRQKVGASLALMFDPRLLILDEPTAGLDPKASYKFKQLLRSEKDNGKTVLLTTHIMSEIEELADHIIFLVEGHVRYHGRMSDLMELQQEQRLEGAVAKMMEENAA